MTVPEFDLSAARAALRAAGLTIAPDAAPFWFGNEPVLGNQLTALVRSGQKRATASLLWLWEAEGDELPAVGQQLLVFDWSGNCQAVVEVTEVSVVPFSDVDGEFACLEGEGDRTLSWWRRAHWDYFSAECRALGREPDESMPVVCISWEKATATA